MIRKIKTISLALMIIAHSISVGCVCADPQHDTIIEAETEGISKAEKLSGEVMDVSGTNSEGYIVFGNYEQDGDSGNGAEPIEWEVISDEGDRMLVISRYILDCKSYNDTDKAVTWETSSLRKWLNSSFLNTAFTGDEQGAIETVTLVNSDNEKHGTDGGNDTKDKIFCLSMDELLQNYEFNYWEESGKYGYCQAFMTEVTAYAKKQGEPVFAMSDDSFFNFYKSYGYTRDAIGKDCGIWWLRSTGGSSISLNSGSACMVTEMGQASWNGGAVTTKIGVRPALYLNKKQWSETVTTEDPSATDTSDPGEVETDVNGWKGFYRYDENTTITVNEVYDDRIVIVETGLDASGESRYETEKELYFTHKSGVEAFEPFQNGSGEVLYKLKPDRITVVYPDGWWEDRDYMKVDAGGDIESDLLIELSGKYKPYPTIALKATSNGCYVTCDVGSKNSDGEYTKFDNPDINVNADKIGEYEKFNLVSCSDGSFGLQSEVNRQYLKRPGDIANQSSSDVYFTSDFIERDEELEFIDAGNDRYKIRFKTLNMWGQHVWLVVKDGKLKTDVFDDKAEIFEKVLISDNAYSEPDKNILTSSEWFDLNGEGIGGYWNIQDEIGRFKEDWDGAGINNTQTLRRLGYYMMHRADKPNNKTIEHDNMQCAIGVKDDNGIYDVIITFQGTGGYSDDFWADINSLFLRISIRDTLSNLTGLGNATRYNQISCHSGYKEIALKLRDINKTVGIVGNVDGTEITLTELINKAKYGGARFTILGHSMGGAIAQLYAIYLVNSGIDPSMIRGRTFNSALALAGDEMCNAFTDWYNVCVTSDTVANGLVTGSINKYGVHRLGKTLWLYDNEPEVGTGHAPAVNIATDKHNMDQKLKEILEDMTKNSFQGFHQADDRLYITNRDNVRVYRRPLNDADVLNTLGMNEFVEIDAYLYNVRGNKWYRTAEGGYIYSNNVDSISRMGILDKYTHTYKVSGNNVPLRKVFYEDAEVITRLGAGTEVYPEYTVCNRVGHKWYYVKAGDNYGWLYSGRIQRNLNFSKMLEIRCPVDVYLYDKNGNLVASISGDNDIFTTDESKVLPYITGDARIFEISDDTEYRIEMSSFADGTMEYKVCGDYDAENGEYNTIKEFMGVNLEEDKYFESEIGGGIKTEKTELNVVDKDGKVIDKVNADGTEGENKSTKKGMAWVIILSAAVVFAILIVILFIRSRKKKGKLMRIKQSAQAGLEPQEKQLDVNTTQSFNTRFCAKCGSPLDSEQLYCGVCGTKRI